MGLDLRLIASLDAIAIDNAGNKIELVVENSFECWNMSTKQNYSVLESENPIETYRKLIPRSSRHLIEFIAFIEKYKNWNLKFQDI